TRVLMALRHELSTNVVLTQETQIWHAHVPFRHAALDEALRYPLDLPKLVLLELRTLGAHISRFNALVDYVNHQVPLGLGAGDDSLNEESGRMISRLSRALEPIDQHILDTAVTNP